MRSKNEIVYVYGKSSFYGTWHYGKLGCKLNNGMQTFHYLYFNKVIGRLAWLSDETNDYIIIKKVTNKQLNLLFDYDEK